MITIIFAPPRTGKTALLSHLLNEYAYDHERTMAMQNEVQELNACGYNFSIPPHCVSANYKINFYKFGYSRQQNRLISPYRLGYSNPFVKTHVNLPYEVIGIQEAQRYFNSRRSANFPEWQSRWFEQLGHNDIDVLMDTQRPTLIDLNIRELARFYEVVDMTPFYNKHGDIFRVIWNVRIIDNNGLLELYLASGRRNLEYCTQKQFVANYDVFEIYNTQNCKTRFYKDFKKQDFNFNDNVEDEMPENFYKTKLKEEKKKDA